MLCLSGFELYFRWVPLLYTQYVLLKTKLSRLCFYLGHPLVVFQEQLSHRLVKLLTGRFMRRN